MSLRPAAVTLLLAVTAMPAQQPPEPDPQHRKLADLQGRWDVAIEALEPNGKTNSTHGASTMRLLANGSWLIEDFAGTLDGLGLQAHGISGFDPAKGRFVTSWVNSWTSSLVLLEGDYDKDGKVLTMTGTGPDPDGKPARYRTVTTWIDKDRFTFEMFVTRADSKEQRTLRMAYTRQQLRRPPK